MIICVEYCLIAFILIYNHDQNQITKAIQRKKVVTDVFDVFWRI